jgi:hypothetical protein
MGAGQTELQVTWSAANSLALATGNSWAATSDSMTFATTTVAAQIALKADQTTGTPASGDYVDWYLRASLGDPDGASTEEYDSAGHDIFLGRTDVNIDDPAIMTVQLPAPLLKCQIRAEGAGFASTDVCTVSATILQLTMT